MQCALGGSVGGLLVAPLSSSLSFGLGCRLFVDLNGMVALALPIGGLPVPGGGTASLTLAIPPGLQPMQLASEAIVLDFASPFFVSGTGGVRVEIR